MYILGAQEHVYISFVCYAHAHYCISWSLESRCSRAVDSIRRYDDNVYNTSSQETKQTLLSLTESCSHAHPPSV